MISVTLGTISYPFDRAIRWLKVCLEQELITEPVFVQHGATSITSISDHPLVTTKRVISSEEWLGLILRSKLVISHAGQGSTRKLAEKNASFILLPRLAMYGEHVDDHQLMFAQSIRHTGIQHCTTIEEFQKTLKNPPLPFQGNLLKGPRLAHHLLKKYSENLPS